MNPRDKMISYLAGLIRDGDLVSTGVASLIPFLAVALAKRTYAPASRFITCSGAVDPVFEQAGLSSDDSSTFSSWSSFVPLPSLFDRGVRGGIDVMFFSGAQIDQSGRINLTSIGDYLKPKVKLPGPAGSTVMLRRVQRPVLFTLQHTTRTLVAEVDFVTADGCATRDSIELVTELGVLTLRKDAPAVMTARFSDLSEQEIQERTAFPLVFQNREAREQDIHTNTAILNELDPEGRRYH